MTIDVSAVGWKSEPTVMRYGWQQLTLYALGIGARASDLDYLYEGRGPRAFPTFAVVPALPQVITCAKHAGVLLDAVVHGGQMVHVLGKLPAEGVLVTRGEIRAVYDLRILAQLMVRTFSELEDGTPICETDWAIHVRGAGGFGGSPPPKVDRGKVPSGQKADVRIEQTTLPEQALIYRLSGDTNPLHADPEVAQKHGFERGPILHGLATLGYSARAIVAAACDGDADRLRFIQAQFRRPAWPGETLATDIWHLPDRYVFQTRVLERNEVVINNAWACIDKLTTD